VNAGVFPRNGEAEAGSAQRALARRVSSPEPLKNVRHLVLTHAHTGVLNNNGDGSRR
jgi:hypothetical protein